jgi:hypothetical protein
MLAYMNLKTFSKDEITYNLLLLQTDGIVVAEVKDFVIRSIEKSDRSNGDIAHKIVWTEIELCTGANSISTDLTQREEDEETISDKYKDCSFLCKSETEMTSEESTNSDTEKNDISKENISFDNKVKDRIFVFISRDKDTALTISSNNSSPLCLRCSMCPVAKSRHISLSSTTFSFPKCFSKISSLIFVVSFGM